MAIGCKNNKNNQSNLMEYDAIYHNDFCSYMMWINQLSLTSYVCVNYWWIVACEKYFDEYGYSNLECWC